MSSQSRIAPIIKDYRDAAASTKSRTPLKPPTSKFYQRQQPIQQSRLTPPTPDKYRRDESRDPVGTRHKDRLTDNLQYKIQSILKHNSHLLNENAALGELLTEKNTQIEILEKRLEAQMNEEVNTLNLIEIEKNRFLAEVDERIRQKEVRIDELNGEVSRLKDTLVELENLKNREMALQKDQISRFSYQQMEALKKAHMNNSEMYEIQVKKLRQALDQKQQKLQSQQHQNKLLQSKLRQHISQLQNQLKHASQMRQLQLSQCKLHYQNVVEKVTRQTCRKLQSQKSAHQTSTRKLKKQLNDRILQVQRLTNKICKSSEDNDVEYEFLKDDKRRLEVAMMELEARLREDLVSQKNRLTELSQAEIETLQVKNRQFHDALESENGKIREVCREKGDEIERLQGQLEGVRRATEQEFAVKDRMIQELKNKLEEQSQSSLQEVELLKVKMAQLFNGDVKTLRDYYENQITALNEQIASLNNFNRAGRDNLQKEIEDKSQLRKALELELSAEKIKVAELRMKLANASVEMKQGLQNVGTKMQLTSQTLLRETHHKQRNVAILQDQKKKLHDLIRSKDTQIHQLTQQIQRLKKQLSETSARNQQQIADLKAARQQLDSSHSKQRQFYDKQLKRKQSLMKQQKQQLQQQLAEVKQSTYEQLKKEIAELRKENLRLVKEVEGYQRQLNSHSKEIALHKDNLEVIRMESSVALEEQKDASSKNKQSQQTSMKSFYEETLNSKNRDIEDLKHKLTEKDSDLRDLIVKYNALEKKLAALLETQEKLRDFETKVVSLGQDTNILKNMAEMIKSRGK